MNNINFTDLAKNLEVAMKSFETATAEAFRVLKKEDPAMAEKLMNDFNRVKAAKSPEEINDLMIKYANISKQ
jgi:uncharacterized protein YfaA (DUF2138 family)